MAFLDQLLNFQDSFKMSMYIEGYPTLLLIIVLLPTDFLPSVVSHLQLHCDLHKYYNTRSVVRSFVILNLYQRFT